MKITALSPQVDLRVNLRADDNGNLVPVGAPASLSPDGTPLYVTDTLAAIARGNNLDIVEEGADGPVTLHLQSPPRAIADTAAGLLVMTDAGAMTLARDDGSWTATPRSLPPSPITLTCEPEAQTTAYIYSHSFASKFPVATGAISSADLNTVGTLLNRAYVNVALDCRRAGLLVQPVVGYVRLLDGARRELYRSCPVVLGPPDGLNFTGLLTARLITDGTNATGLSSISIPVTPYKVVVRLNAGADDALLARASSVEVCLSPQIHPVDTSRSHAPACRIEGASTSAPSVAMYYHGVSSGMTPIPEVCAPAVTAVLASADRCVKAACEVCLSASARAAMSSADGLQVRPLDFPTPYLESKVVNDCIAAVAAATAADVETDETADVVARCRPPHTFTATAAAVSGPNVVWANPSPRLFDGYRCAEMARRADTGGDSAAIVEVDLPGERVVATSTGPGAAALTLSPLVCYPLPGATAMRITVRTSAGDMRRLELPLRSIPGCPFSFWLNPSLRPVDVAEGEEVTSLAPPSSLRLPRSFPGMVVTARSADPFVPQRAIRVDSGELSAVVPAMRDASGWSFNYSRFCALGSSALSSFLISGSHAAGSLVTLARGTPRKLFYGGGRLMALVDGDLLHIKGSQAVTLLHGVADAGWCRRHDELWALMADGTLRVYDRSLSTWYRRDDITVGSLHSAGARLVVATADGELLDAEAEHPVPMRVGWHARFTTYPDLAPIARFYMLGSTVSGTAALLADDLPVTTFAIAGSLAAPLACRVEIPSARPAFAAAVDLSVLPDFIFSYFSLDPPCH